MQDTKIELDIQSLNINGDAKAIREKGYLYQPRPNLYGRAIITSTECGSLSKRKKSTTRVVPQKQYPIHKLPKLFYAQAPGDLNYERLPLLDLNHYLPLIGDCLVVKILKVSPWRLTTLTKLDSTTGKLRLEFHKVKKSVTFEIKDLFEIRRFIV